MLTMTEILLWINVALALALVLEVVLEPQKYCELPLIIGGMYIVWFLPQVWRISNDPTADQTGLAHLLLMSFLSLAFVKLGWMWGRGSSIVAREPIRLPTKRLIRPVIILTAFAWGVNTLIFLRPVEEILRPGWTGPLTILFFLSSVGIVSLVISVAMALAEQNWITISLACINVSLYIPKVFIGFRREESFELAFAFLLGAWIVRRFLLPRLALVCLAVLGMLMLNGAAQLRSIAGYRLGENGTLVAKRPTLADVRDIDWTKIATFDVEGTPSEATNAMQYMKAADSSGSLTLGAEFWNTLIAQYVPAQIVGKDMKDSLTIGSTNADLAMTELNYDSVRGITSTGFSAPYRDFWFFGSLVFFFTSALMGTFYKHAGQGSLTGFVLYSSLFGNAALTVTHSGYYLFTSTLLIVLAAIFVTKSGTSTPLSRHPLRVLGTGRVDSTSSRREGRPDAS